MWCGFFVSVCMHVCSCSSTPFQQIEAQLQGARFTVLASISSFLATSIITCIYISIHKSRQTHTNILISSLTYTIYRQWKHNWGKNQSHLPLHKLHWNNSWCNKTFQFFTRYHMEAFRYPSEKVNEDTQQTLEWKSCRSPLRFVWMQHNKLRQTVVDSCDQATWLPGQASGVHSTVLHKQTVSTENRKGERKSWREGGGGGLHVNGPDLYFKKEWGR